MKCLIFFSSKKKASINLISKWKLHLASRWRYHASCRLIIINGCDCLFQLCFKNVFFLVCFWFTPSNYIKCRSATGEGTF